MKKKKVSSIYPRNFKRFVMSVVKAHSVNIGVSHYDVDLYYHKAAKDHHGEHLDDVVAADCGVQRRYLKASINIYPVTLKYWKQSRKETVEEIICHEVAHIATQHFFDVATARYCDDGEMKDAWETLTEIVAQLSVKSRSVLKDIKHGKKN